MAGITMIITKRERARPCVKINVNQSRLVAAFNIVSRIKSVMCISTITKYLLHRPVGRFTRTILVQAKLKVRRLTVKAKQVSIFWIVGATPGGIAKPIVGPAAVRRFAQSAGIRNF